MLNDFPKLLGIAIRRRSRGEMLEISQAMVDKDFGVENDFRGSPGKRQVTVLSLEAWKDACAELNDANHLLWTARRANLLISGLNLEDSSGKLLRIGPVELEITGETAPCSRMEEAHEGLQTSLLPSWRGGVTCRVHSNGTISIGDCVSLINR